MFDTFYSENLINFIRIFQTNPMFSFVNKISTCENDVMFDGKLAFEAMHNSFLPIFILQVLGLKILSYYFNKNTNSNI